MTQSDAKWWQLGRHLNDSLFSNARFVLKRDSVISMSFIHISWAIYIKLAALTKQDFTCDKRHFNDKPITGDVFTIAWLPVTTDDTC